MEDRFVIHWRYAGSLLIILSFCLAFSCRCSAKELNNANVAAAHLVKPQKMTLTVSKSTVIKSTRAVKRVTLVTPKMADVVVLTPNQIYIAGKVPGITNLTLWDGDDKITDIFDLEILPEINTLKRKLYEIYPQEKDIQVRATYDNITISGSVSSASIMSRVLALAKSYAPKNKNGEPRLINSLEVGGVHQVMLEVRVSEMSRSIAKRLGVNFKGVSSSGQQFGVTLLDGLTSGIGQSTGLSNRINLAFSFLTGDSNISFFIDALKDNGLLKLLAEPTLITLSGRPAQFLAGGEFPVPIAQEGGGGTRGATITIEWKQFGVGLVFTPTVLNNGKISMEIAPEVSELDFSNAVSVSGFRIPALDVRRISTVVELGDGQSFVIAGLLRDDTRQNIQKYPLVGDVPILGALFRSSQYQKKETELVFIVTPHLVKPVDMAKQTLPTDQYIDPDDFEFYVLGEMEGRRKTAVTASNPSALIIGDDKGGMEGDFGQIKP